MMANVIMTVLCALIIAGCIWRGYNSWWDGG